MSLPQRVLGGLVPLLGLAFVWAGGAKANDPAGAVGLFASWGLEPWTVATAGWAEVGLGLLLVHPPTRRAGALALGGWMVLFGSLQLRAGQGAAAAASAAVLLVCLAELSRGRGSAASGGIRALLPTPLLDPPETLAGAARRLTRLVGVSFLVRWAVGGILFWCALPLLAWGHAGRAEGRTRELTEAVLLHLLVLGLGVSGLWGFVGHAFMADTVSASVGWPASPFQSELAFYHLGVGCAGLACWWVRDRFWLAAALIPSVFLYGAGLVHLESFLRTGNTAPANWGPGVLFGNVLVPTALLALSRARPPGAGASLDRPEPGSPSGGV